jgi:hypothetical protein
MDLSRTPKETNKCFKLLTCYVDLYKLSLLNYAHTIICIVSYSLIEVSWEALSDILI